MQRLTQEGVLAMQFEDIVSQMMNRITQKTLNVGESIFTHSSICTRTATKPTAGTCFKHRTEKLLALLVESHTKIDAIGSPCAGIRRIYGNEGHRTFLMRRFHHRL